MRAADIGVERTGLILDDPYGEWFEELVYHAVSERRVAIDRS